MKQFRLSCVVGVSALTIVEANTLEEAVVIAEGRAVVIGGHGTGTDETEEWIIEEADGMPTDIHAAD